MPLPHTIGRSFGSCRAVQRTVRGLVTGGVLLSLAGGVVRSQVTPPAAAQDLAFTLLFNGRDLSGWFNINCAPGTWTVRDGMIHSTGAPICELRTERMYENFVLELEYQHLKAGGNAGVFVWADALPARGQPFLRAIEVQVLDGRETANYTSHGDVFSIHGARMTPDRPHPAGWSRSLPSEKRAKPAGQWNHYRITCRNGTVKLAVNGAEVSGGYDITPRKGYIALESEGSPTLFRNVRIAELPPSGSLMADQIASTDDGFRALYNGQDLTGWRVASGAADRWTPKDWILTVTGSPAGSTATAAAGASAGSSAGSGAASHERTGLVSDEEYGDFVLMVDWRLPKSAGGMASPERPASTGGDSVSGGGSKTGSSKSSGGSSAASTAAPAWIGGARLVVTPRLGDSGASADGWNRSVYTVKGDRLTMTLNGKTVLDDVAHTGSRRGRVALAPEGAIELANVFMKRLP